MESTGLDLVRKRSTSRGQTVALGLGILGVMFVEPLREGTPIAEVAAGAGFVVFWVLVPGFYLWRLLSPVARDHLVDLGMGASFGTALAMLAFLGAKITGSAIVFLALPLSALPLAALERRRSRAELRVLSIPGPTSACGLVLFALLLAGAVLSEVSDGAHAHLVAVHDSAFHAANAAEYLHHWPLRDARLAGHPFKYHFFSYGVPAGASLVTGLPIWKSFFCILPCVLPTILALQVFNAGRIVGSSAIAGLVAAGLVVLHEDAGALPLRFSGSERVTPFFNDFLSAGLYTSPSTSAGLSMFVSILILMALGWRAPRAHLARVWIGLAIIALAASGSKGSIMPVACAGTAALGVWTWARERRVDRRALFGLCIMVLASAPMTLYLSLGETSYAQSMFTWDPGFVIRRSSFYRFVAEHLGTTAAELPRSLPLLFSPLWLVGYLGVIAVGLVARGLAHRPLTRIDRWLIACGAVALVPALLLGAPGYSNLFFFYPAQVGLACLVARDLVDLVGKGWTRWPIASTVGALVCAAFAVNGLGLTSIAWRDRWSRQPPARTGAVEIRAGLEWLRTSSPPDAVMVSSFIIPSACTFAERRALFETGAFAPITHDRWRDAAMNGPEVGPRPDPFAARRDLRDRVIHSGDPLTIDELRETLGRTTPSYLIEDRRAASGSRILGALADREELNLEYENPSVAIYRIR